jgi:hypothetical protein
MPLPLGYLKQLGLSSMATGAATKYKQAEQQKHRTIS